MKHTLVIIQLSLSIAAATYQQQADLAHLKEKINHIAQINPDHIEIAHTDPTHLEVIIKDEMLAIFEASRKNSSKHYAKVYKIYEGKDLGGKNLEDEEESKGRDDQNGNRMRFNMIEEDRHKMARDLDSDLDSQKQNIEKLPETIEQVETRRHERYRRRTEEHRQAIIKRHEDLEKLNEEDRAAEIKRYEEVERLVEEKHKAKKLKLHEEAVKLVEEKREKHRLKVLAEEVQELYENGLEKAERLTEEWLEAEKQAEIELEAERLADEQREAEEKIHDEAERVAEEKREVEERRHKEAGRLVEEIRKAEERRNIEEAERLVDEMHLEEAEKIIEEMHLSQEAIKKLPFDIQKQLPVDKNIILEKVTGKDGETVFKFRLNDKSSSFDRDIFILLLKLVIIPFVIGFIFYHIRAFSYEDIVDTDSDAPPQSVQQPGTGKIDNSSYDSNEIPKDAKCPDDQNKPAYKSNVDGIEEPNVADRKDYSKSNSNTEKGLEECMGLKNFKKSRERVLVSHQTGTKPETKNSESVVEKCEDHLSKSKTEESGELIWMINWSTIQVSSTNMPATYIKKVTDQHTILCICQLVIGLVSFIYNNSPYLKGLVHGHPTESNEYMKISFTEPLTIANGLNYLINAIVLKKFIKQNLKKDLEDETNERVFWRALLKRAYNLNMAIIMSNIANLILFVGILYFQGQGFGILETWYIVLSVLSVLVTGVLQSQDPTDSLFSIKKNELLEKKREFMRASGRSKSSRKNNDN